MCETGSTEPDSGAKYLRNGVSWMADLYLVRRL
jgi:hypothetical protein